MEVQTITPKQHKRLIALADAHRRKDEYIQNFGYQWEEGSGACSVGCTIHDAKAEGFCNGVRYDDHKALAKMLGVTEYMTRMQDQIFEGLPEDKARAWTGRFLRAIKPGVDYSTVATRMSIACLRDKQIGLAAAALSVAVRTVSELIADLYERRLNGDEPKSTEWDAAWQQADAARQQADAARQQADAAWHQADAARQQADAARQQADAAWHQADAARQQADAARQQAYAAWHQADAAWQQADAAWHQADAAWHQADAARQQAYAARQQAYAARQQAYAAWQQAYAAWQQFWTRCADLMIAAMKECA